MESTLLIFLGAELVKAGVGHSLPDQGLFSRQVEEGGQPPEVLLRLHQQVFVAQQQHRDLLLVHPALHMAGPAAHELAHLLAAPFA